MSASSLILIKAEFKEAKKEIKNSFKMITYHFGDS
jgi:hypothetical protein